MAGAVGGILFARVAGKLLEHYDKLGTIEAGYYILFFICAFAYLTSWILIHVLSPKMNKVEI